MGKIYDSIVPNTFGGGHEQIMEVGNKTYKISNSIVPNTFGEGYEKNIEEISTDGFNPFLNCRPSMFGKIITKIGLILVAIGELFVLGIGVWFMFLVISAMIK